MLLLHSFGLNFSPYNDYVAHLRGDLARQSPGPVDIYEVSLATARFTEGEREGPFVEYVNSLFADRRPDLVVSIGAPAAGFAQRYREQLFPSTPLLLSAVEERRLKGASLLETDAAVSVKIDLPAVIDNIFTVLPETAHVAVVIGDSPLEKFWLDEMRREFRQFESRIELIWLNELPFGDMLKRVAALPPHSAIFFGLLSVDAAGVPYEEDRALAAVHAAANAPIFSFVDAHFGKGIVGGPLISLAGVSREAAAVAGQILRGNAPEPRLRSVGYATSAFDWRELRRWGVSEASLPVGSVVQFHEPTTWERYRWQILLGGTLFALQAGLIVVLLMSARQLRIAYAERKRAEDAAHELSGRLIRAQEEERSRLARELHDDVTQRLALLAIDAGREERHLAGAAGGAAMRSMRDGLARLSEDVHALSHRLHPSILEDLGLVEALKAECERFSRICVVHVDASDRFIPDRIPRDVALCLFRIAQEALNNITRHAKANRVEIVLRRLDGGLELVIADNGIGFDSAHNRPGRSLGHASMRQRVLLLGGKLDIDSSPGLGTTIWAWVPLKEVASESAACATG